MLLNDRVSYNYFITALVRNSQLFVDPGCIVASRNYEIHITFISTPIHLQIIHITLIHTLIAIIRITVIRFTLSRIIVIHLALIRNKTLPADPYSMGDVREKDTCESHDSNEN